MKQDCQYPDTRITPQSGRIRVHFDDMMIADTGRALDLKERSCRIVKWLSRDAVAHEILTSSDHHTNCPLKGAG